MDGYRLNTELRLPSTETTVRQVRAERVEGLNGTSIPFDGFEDGEIIEPDPHDQQVTNGEMVVQGCGSTTLDLKFDFWKCYLIEQVVKYTGKPNSLGDTIYSSIMTTQQLAQRDIQAWKAAITVYSIDEELVEHSPFEVSDVATFNNIEAMLDNPSYQRNNHEEACRELGIHYRGDNTVLRMPRMALSQALKKWQPVGVKFLRDMKAYLWLKGCFLSDMMGLGKTWEIIALLLSVSTCHSMEVFLSFPTNAGGLLQTTLLILLYLYDDGQEIDYVDRDLPKPTLSPGPSHNPMDCSLRLNPPKYIQPLDISWRCE